MRTWFAIPIVFSLVVGAGAQAPRARAYESVTIDANGNLRIVTANRQTIIVPKAEDQTQFEDLSIASDHSAVGALEDYRTPCCSYNIPLSLTVYAYGKARHFGGGGFMISGWHFVDGGRRVAIGTTTVRGNCAVGWELREVSSRRLVASAIDKKDCDPNDAERSPRPSWIDGDSSGLK